jgi:PKHD-type hydroxylase
MVEAVRIDRGIKSDRWKLEQVDWVSWDNEFSDNELKLITDYCEQQLSLFGSDKDYGGKKVTLSNLGEISFIKDRISKIAQQVNKDYFQFNLSNAMNISYIKFQKENYLPWHMDNVLWINEGDDPESITFIPRKLTMVLQLSNSDEYEGGEFRIVSDGGEYSAVKKKGIFNIFPGYMVHTVTPIISGIRRVLQITCTGSKFR